MSRLTTGDVSYAPGRLQLQLRQLEACQEASEGRNDSSNLKDGVERWILVCCEDSSEVHSTLILQLRVHVTEQGSLLWQDIKTTQIVGVDRVLVLFRVDFELTEVVHTKSRNESLKSHSPSFAQCSSGQHASLYAIE